uniref:C3H1-type domain-containing protein n=1 Tax=Ganoderma boninense TaxID=34458 RepID=A0A5K1K6E9_9APHY|nr:C3H1-type domain-containing protein [Ganoderma boninense]
MSSYINEKASGLGPDVIRTSLPEDANPKLDEQTVKELQAEQDAHLGVKAVEAAEKVYGRYSKWLLFIGLALASYVYSLDGTTTSNYLAFATSAFDKHSLLSTILVAESVIRPVIAKVADVTSRAMSFLGILIFYVLGYIVIASANNVGALAAGLILYTVGFQLLLSIIVADITTLKWRGFVSSLVSGPFVVNAFVGGNIATQVIERSGWRWGYGMFAILIPAALSPLLVTLFWAEQKAKRLGLVPVPATSASEAQGAPVALPRRVWTFVQQLDIVGLLLIGTSIALILLPLTLAPRAHGGWHNASMIAMLVVGVVLMPAFVAWEILFAQWPAIPRRFLANKTVVLAAWISLFEFFSATLTSTYLYSFILITKDWSLVNITYFNQAQSVALVVFGIIAGLSMRFLHRAKWVLAAGLAVRLLGVGLMIHSRGANGSAAEIVWTQILQGMGGGFSVVAASVAAQASVPHVDMATATAILFVWSEIGSAIGSAVAGAIWTSEMPVKLAEHLPGTDQATRDALFGSITDVMAFPFGDPTREGAIAAYGDVMKLMLIAATVVSAVSFLLAFGMPDWYLGDNQNAVDAMDLKGERSDALPTFQESGVQKEGDSKA